MTLVDAPKHVHTRPELRFSLSVMSTVSTPSVAGTTQIWGASKAGDEHVEDDEEVTSRRSSYVDVFQSTLSRLFLGGIANDNGRSPFDRYA